MPNTTDITDEQLVDLLQDPENKERGFRLLVLRYQERLYWQIRKMVDHHDDANDILQNSLIKCYRGIGRFKRQSQLYTWLYRIVTNETLTFLKKQKRRRAQRIDDENLALAHTLKAESYFDADLAQQLLQEAVARLPKKQCIVFQLRYFEEKSYQEIAAMLGGSIGSLKASYHHAVRKIEAYLKQ
ncbi:MAG TPA: sigma-70 family RNA polymerase sigma factor [Saprospiraceae bacterium]|nr:sigma-70 family RNA polymerase sigma factor [Saprospiraceae bacterium]